MILILLLLSILQVKLTLGEPSLEIQTENGKIRGKIMKSRDGRNFAAFEGLRYAETPQRFEVAKPIKNWEGVRSAEMPGSHCIQKMPGEMLSLMGIRGTEDCLFLNVYTPKTDPGEKLPVMIFIHGGAFIFGAGEDYKPNYFMDEDVVLVTINYRLAAFGFLYNDDEIIPGNLGMKDQVLAFQWVQKNIQHFGGDPNSVTIFGESAGAASVHHHMLSPMSAGLFHRAIAQSGTALNPWAFIRNPKENAKRFAEELGCPSDDTTAMLDCLRQKDAKEIVETGIEAEWGPDLTYHWAPVAEITKDPKSAFLTTSPKEIIGSNMVVTKVPLMTGVMKNEGAAICSGVILHNSETTAELNSTWSKYAPEIFIYDDVRNKVMAPDVASQKIRDFYFKGVDIELSTEQRLTDVYSDWFFNYWMEKAVEAHAPLAPTYTYVMTNKGSFSILHMMNYYDYEPPTHGDDIFQLFPFMMVPPLHTPSEIKFSKALVKLWVSFARTGEPVALWGPAKEWAPLDLKNTGMVYYKLDVHSQLLRDPFSCRMKFWEDLATNELRQV